MAFANIGSLGTASSKVSGQTLSVAVSRAVPVGRLVVIWTAWEIDYGGTPEGDRIGNIKVTDDKNNIYSTVASFMFESNCGLHVARIGTALEAGDNITCIHRNASKTPKAMSVEEFSMPLSKRWAVVESIVSGGQGIGSGDPVVLGIGSLEPQEYLYLHTLSSRGPDTDVYTADPDFTQINGDGTTGGADTSNVHVRGFYRIATGTGDSSDVTSDTADRDCDQVLVALCEVQRPTFPRFGVLDNFNRADEQPLDQATPVDPDHYWDWDAGGGPVFGNGQLRVLNNQCTRGLLTGAGAAQYWHESYTSCYVEAWVTMVVSGDLGVQWDASGDGSAAFFDAGQVFWLPKLGSTADDVIYLGNAGNTGDPAGQLLVWMDQVDGYKLGGCRISKAPPGVVGTTSHAFVDRGDGWEWAGALFQSLFPRGGGQLVLSHWGSFTTVSDNFGGGWGQCVGGNRPRIIRRTHRRGGYAPP